MALEILLGRAGSPGIGVGRALVIGTTSMPSAVGGNGTGASAGRVAFDPLAETGRLRTALSDAASALQDLATRTAEQAGADVGVIFEAQALFALDPGIVDPALRFVADGVPADDAILRSTDAQADQLAAVDDAFFRERAADVRDVGRRVAAILRGEPPPDLWHDDGSPAIVLADDLDPSAVATLRRELVRGIALAGGAPTGHAAIVARALGIPLVLGLGAALAEVPSSAQLAVDGETGRVFVEPSVDDLAALARAGIAAPGAPASVAAAPHDAPDGAIGSTHGVAILANVGSALEAEAAARSGADGIGLVRTELLFIGRSTPPSVAEQRAMYARILDVMGDRPVVFRTLDVGGDKPASWQAGPAELNPALGVRGIRLGLRRAELLDDQFEALLRAAAGRDLRVMLPMVATREELDAARERLTAVQARIAADGATPRSVRLGVMIEVPSAALMADALAASADFFSIGTNDLVQYTLAADRTNAELADLATTLQPSVLRLIDLVVRAARGRGRHVGVCGEAAADPRCTGLLVGLGVDELSVAPGSLAAVRARVATLDPAAAADLARRALEAPTAAAVATLLGGDLAPG
jgi:phosphoenolpyruvate-protein phosphotransferase